MIVDNVYIMVIATTYNRNDMLPDAIESFLAQDYPYKKLFIIDDGSTDGTRDTCLRYVQENKGTVFYYYKNNAGCASARNFGLDLVHDTVGYVCFLDSDDRLLPEKLSREIELLNRFPEADFVYSDTIVYCEKTSKERLSKAAAGGNPNKIAIRHFQTNRICSGAVLYRVSTVRTRRFDESLRYNEDSDFFQQICIEHKAIYSPSPGYWAREHEGSKSTNLVEIQKAVLYTNHKISCMYPEFYHRHSRLIERRNRKIGRMHFVALMMEHRYDEADHYVRNPVCKMCYYSILRSLYALKPYVKKLLGR
jgi:glycosyltransferase involved in cell wall biosynthesis